MTGSDRDVREWLEAESLGSADADARFAAVFARRVPRLAPRPGLAGRVATALGDRRSALLPVPRWARAAALVLLTFGGLAVAAFSSAWAFDLPRAAAAAAFGPRTVRLGFVAGSWVLDFVNHGCSVAVAIGRALAVVAATGPATAAIAVNLTIALVAALALRRLLSPAEE